MTKLIGLAVAVLFVVGLAGSAAQAEETLQGMLAAQLRAQGYACDKPLKAERDDKLSKPDNEAWTHMQQRDLPRQPRAGPPRQGRSRQIGSRPIVARMRAAICGTSPDVAPLIRATAV